MGDESQSHIDASIDAAGGLQPPILGEQDIRDDLRRPTNRLAAQLVINFPVGSDPLGVDQARRVQDKNPGAHREREVQALRSTLNEA